MPSPGLLTLLTWVYAAIGSATVLTWVIPALRRPEARAVRLAITSWWYPALFGTAVVLAPRPVGLALWAGLCAWALAEYLRLVHDVAPSTRMLAFATIPWALLALTFGRPTDFVAWVSAWIFLALPLLRLLREGPGGMLSAGSAVQVGLVLCVVSLGQVAWLLQFGPGLLHTAAGAPGAVALLLSSVMVNDAAQYVWGKALGRHPLAPRVSPKKTWEGFLGGAATTAAVTAASAQVLLDLRAVEGAVLGGALSVLGLAGDLLVSSMKRDSGIKDSGNVLPGQGGILDRCDSLLLAAPAFAGWVALWPR